MLVISFSTISKAFQIVYNFASRIFVFYKKNIFFFLSVWDFVFPVDSGSGIFLI